MKKYFKIFLFIGLLFLCYKVNASDFGDLSNIDYAEARDCATILGPNIIKLIKFFIKLIRIVGTIACVLLSMLNIVPAVSSGDAGALKKASSKVISSIIILLLIYFVPLICSLIVKVTNWDGCGIF